MYKYILPATLFFFLLACGHQKHTTTGNNNKPQHNWWDDGNELKYDSARNAESQVNYNPSATRFNDLLHTRLDVRFDYAKRWMYGKATIEAKPYFYPQTTLVLDARGMQIDRVALIDSSAGKNDTAKTDYTYANNQLTIQLGRTFTRDEHYTVYIEYVAKPDELPAGGSAAISEDKGLYFVYPDADPKDSVLHPRQIWTQGETQSNSVWMPTIDCPNERMTSEIYMTVENKYVTLSNGLLTDQHKNADGTRTDHWKMDLPSAPYLVMMAVGSFSVIKDSWKGKDVNYYVEPQFAPYAKEIFGNTPEMIEFFSNKLGVPYAWPKYSQICAREYVSGAMENTSATLHSDFLQQDTRELLDGDNEDYISHELFHQWFGDLVTCESWSNLPLNESFATYGEYLWDEYKYGKEVADYSHYSSLGGYFRESAAGHRTPEWPGVREPLIRYYYRDREDMFDGHSYNKGGQVLHLLRQYVGDDAFFASLKLYLETKKFSSGEIDDLRLAFEQVTGQDLRWFFNEWFMERGHPELNISYSYDEANKKQRVIIKQTQDRTDGTPIFRIPLSIDIYHGDKTERKEVIVQTICDTFYFDAATKPDFVNVDAQKTLPCFKVDNHSANEWAFLYEHSKLYVDRVEAINALAPKPLPGEMLVSTQHMNWEIAKKVVTEALNDEFWAIRDRAAGRIGECAAEASTTLIALSKNDPKSDVRSAAIDALANVKQDENMKQAYIAALNDSSYAVITSALLALAKNYHDEGLVACKARENDPSRSMKLAVGSAYGYYGSDEQQAWFEKNLPTLCGGYQLQFVQEYGALLRRCHSESVYKALPQWENLYNTTQSGVLQLYLKGTLRDISIYYRNKSGDLQKQIDDLGSVKNDATGLDKLKADKEEADAIAAAVTNVVRRLK